MTFLQLQLQPLQLWAQPHRSRLTLQRAQCQLLQHRRLRAYHRQVLQFCIVVTTPGSSATATTQILQGVNNLVHLFYSSFKGCSSAVCNRRICCHSSSQPAWEIPRHCDIPSSRCSNGSSSPDYPGIGMSSFIQLCSFAVNCTARSANNVNIYFFLTFSQLEVALRWVAWQL